MKHWKQILWVSLFLFLAVCIAIPGIAEPEHEKKYHRAEEYVARGMYAEAAKELEGFGNYEDATRLIMYCQAVIAGESGNYEAAFTTFSYLGSDYRDTDLMQIYYSARQYEALAPAEEKPVTYYLNAASLYQQIPFFRDSTTRKEACYRAAYDDACQKAGSGNYTLSIQEFNALGNYLDSSTLALKAKADSYFDQGNLAKAWEIFQGLDSQYQTHLKDYEAIYQSASNLRESGQFYEAAAQYQRLGSYSSSAVFAKECMYSYAEKLISESQFTEALGVYSDIKDTNKIAECHYLYAQHLLSQGLYSSAAKQFSECISYMDSREQRYQAGLMALNNEKPDEAFQILKEDLDYKEAKKTLYQLAESAVDNQQYDLAISAYKALNYYKDSRVQYLEVSYLWGNLLYDQGEYTRSSKIFSALGSYSNAQDKVKAANYSEAKKLKDSGDYDGALTYLKLLGSYKDCASLIKDCEYHLAVQLYESGEYKKALNAMEEKNLSGYGDTQNMILGCQYHLGLAAEENNDLTSAIAWFRNCESWEDSSEHLMNCMHRAGVLCLEQADYENAVQWFLQSRKHPDTIKELERIVNCCKQTEMAQLADYASQAVLHVKAETYMDTEDYSGAIDCYKRITYKALKENSHLAYYRYGVQLFNEGQYAEALDLYNSHFPGDHAKLDPVHYQYGLYLMQEKSYSAAAEHFTKCIDYRDSREQRYQAGLSAFESGNPEDAFEILKTDPDYKDVKDTLYQIALKASSSENYELSTSAYKLVGTYKDAALELIKDYYRWGRKLYEAQEYEKSAKVFSELGDFSNASEKRKAGLYAYALQLMDAGSYDEAKTYFTALKDYKESQKLLDDCKTKIAEIDKEKQYAAAALLFEQKQYSKALQAFADNKLSGYKETDNMVTECRFNLGKAAEEAGDYITALNYYQSCESIPESKERIQECIYLHAIELKQDKEIDVAVEWFLQAAEHPDSANQIKSIIEFLETTESKDKLEYVNQVYILIKAEQAMNAQDYASAAQYYEQITKAALQSNRKQEAYYNYGKMLLEQGKYTDAINQFTAAKDYSDAEAMLKEAWNLEGERLFAASDFNAAITAFENAEKKQRHDDAVFELAKSHLECDEYEQAYALLTTIVDYPGAYELLTSVPQFLAFKHEIGDIVTFGHYEQDTDEKNGPEGIEWIVLDNKDNKYLLLSRYGLDAKPYNTSYEGIAWETCSLRNWLNTDFLNQAFTSPEQRCIALSEVDNSKSQGIRDWPTLGNNTQDRIFLLSWAEANDYMNIVYATQNNTKGMISTAYAINKGANKSLTYWINGKQTSWWWLRSPGRMKGYAATIEARGTLADRRIDGINGVVRPALWIEFSALQSSIEQAEESQEETKTEQAEESQEKAKTKSATSPLSAIMGAKPDSIDIPLGTIVEFGHYEQDGNTANGKEPISWVVLDKSDGNYLLQSEYILDARNYNETLTDTTWEKSSIRKWLNSTFLKEAFSENEQNQILLADIDNGNEEGSQYWNTDGGKNTQDKIFLLSYKEANKYFNNNKSRIHKATYDAINNKHINRIRASQEADSAYWWLRSPGLLPKNAAIVTSTGIIQSANVTLQDIGICPALWISAEALYSLSQKGPLSSSKAPVVDSTATKRTIKVGDSIPFGRYEQDGMPQTGLEPIEWIALDVQDNKCLLISKYILDAMPYNTKEINMTWESCSLRTWLNKDFIATAFDEGEKNAILTTTVENGSGRGNPSWNTNGGNNTEDNIFLLSYQEARKYYVVDNARTTSPTDYAKKIFKNNNIDKKAGTAAWWTRSPGIKQSHACKVSPSGSLEPAAVHVKECGVRPALWVSLDSDFFASK